MANPDFDGDGRADLVVGDGGTVGRVIVHYGAGTELRFGSRAITGTDATNFGDVLLARDLNADGYTDLVVGSPNSDPAVVEIFGGPSGLDPKGARQLDVPEGLTGFGAALALVDLPTPTLVVAAPGATGGVLTGGAVAMYRLGADGLPSGAPRVVGQGSPEIAGDPETGDGFGSALASTGDWLFIGVPREDLGPARDAGAVVALRFADDGFTASQLTQDSPGVATDPETEDRFGLALAAGDGHLAVGVPLEDLDEPNVGIIQPFEIAGDALKPLPSLDQGTLPGDPEAGDAFGRTLAITRPCAGVAGVLVGAPDEAIGSIRQAGSVWLVPITPSETCKAVQVYEGLNGEPPIATENALYGSAVSVLRTGTDQADTLVIVSAGIREEGVLARVLTLAPPYDQPGVVVLNQLVVREEGRVTLSSPQG